MILIIGGTGFIGKHLCCSLEQSGLSAATFSKQPDSEFLARNAPSIESHPISELHDGLHNNLIRAATTVIHLASSSIPGQTENSVAQELDSNVSQVIEVTEAITSLNPEAHFIYLSSGGTVYGPGHSAPIPETALTKPKNAYAFGKVVIEKYFQHLFLTQKTPYTILRAANPVGEWQQSSKQGFIGVALRNIQQGSSIDIFGDGSAVRDYFDVEDLCNAIIDCHIKKELAIAKTWNVGSGSGQTILEIVAILESVTKSEIKLNFLPRRDIDLSYNVLDCSNIEGDLGWQCSNNLSTAIERIWRNIA